MGKTITLAITAGATGVNLGDSDSKTGVLREATDQASRIRSARQAAKAVDADFFINTRCAVFFHVPPDDHNGDLIRQATERTRIYAEAGADGIFLPGLKDVSLIARFAKTLPLPLNILVGSSGPPLRSTLRMA